jgi:hypothetical protein
MIFFSILNLLDVGLVVLLGRRVSFRAGLAAFNGRDDAKVVRNWVTRCNPA